MKKEKSAKRTSKKKVYAVRNQFFREISIAIISLIVFISIVTTLILYILIRNTVEQGIVMGFVKNLDIMSSTLAAIKMNEWENFGQVMTLNAQILSNLISYPDEYLDTTFLNNYEQYTVAITDMAQCISDPCEHEGHTY